MASVMNWTQYTDYTRICVSVNAHFINIYIVNIDFELHVYLQ